MYCVRTENFKETRLGVSFVVNGQEIAGTAKIKSLTHSSSTNYALFDLIIYNERPTNTKTNKQPTTKMSGTTQAFQISLLIAAFLVTVVFSVAFIFAIVVMPGIGKLDDGEYLHAFQVIDGVIQNNQPAFVTVWIGSVVMILVTMGLGIAELDGPKKAMLITFTVLYMMGQIATVGINIPLNNRLQTLDIKCLDETNKRLERQAFEPKWNFWNVVRTFLFGSASIYLLVLLLLENY